MDSRMDNSDDRKLWQRFAAAEEAARRPGQPCLDDLTMASYLDGRLDAGRVGAVEEHLAVCAGCRRAAAELRGLLSAPATVMPPAGFEARAARVAAPARRREGPWRRAARISAVAAAVLVVAWAGFAAGRKTSLDRRAADAAVAREATFDIEPAGEQVAASVDVFDEMLLTGGDEP